MGPAVTGDETTEADVYTEYDEHPELHDELGDDKYDEITPKEVNLQGEVSIALNGHPEIPCASESVGTEDATSHLSKLVPGCPDPEHVTGGPYMSG